jgi:hypothetical protein
MRPKPDVGPTCLVFALRSDDFHWRTCPTANLGSTDLETEEALTDRGGKIIEPVVRQPIDDMTSTSPKQRADTHRTRLTGRIHNTFSEQSQPPRPVQFPDQGQLGMGRQVRIGHDPVPGRFDDLPVEAENRTERVVAPVAGLQSKIERKRHHLVSNSWHDPQSHTDIETQAPHPARSVFARRLEL